MRGLLRHNSMLAPTVHDQLIFQFSYIGFLYHYTELMILVHFILDEPSKLFILDF